MEPSSSARHNGPGYILILDVGSTFLKCTLFRVTESENLDSNPQRRSPPSGKLKPLATVRAATPYCGCAPDFVEIDPELLFEESLQLIKKCLHENSTQWDDIICVGIASMRNVFLVFDQESGKCLTRFCSWKDKRGGDTVAAWNQSWLARLVRLVGTGANAVLEWNRAIVMAAIYFRSGHILPRLKWMRDNEDDVERAISGGTARIVTIDSWLTAKLTGDWNFVTDYSNVSSWGFFSPATLRWSRPMLWLFAVILFCPIIIHSVDWLVDWVTDWLFLRSSIDWLIDWLIDCLINGLINGLIDWLFD